MSGRDRHPIIQALRVMALSLYILGVASCISLRNIEVAEPESQLNSCNAENTLTAASIEAGKISRESCISGVVYVDREYVLVFPFAQPGDRRMYDIVIFPDGDPNHLREIFAPLNGRKVILRGIFEADADCWHSSANQSGAQIICAPARRPVRFHRGVVWEPTTDSFGPARFPMHLTR